MTKGERDEDVVLGAEVEEAFHPGRGVLSPLPLVTVGEKQGQPRGLAPLDLGRGEELVDDDLGPVDEVAELGLPEHKRLRALL